MPFLPRGFDDIHILLTVDVDIEKISSVHGSTTHSFSHFIPNVRFLLIVSHCGDDVRSLVRLRIIPENLKKTGSNCPLKSDVQYW